MWGAKFGRPRIIGDLLQGNFRKPYQKTITVCNALQAIRDLRTPRVDPITLLMGASTYACPPELSPAVIGQWPSRYFDDGEL